MSLPTSAGSIAAGSEAQLDRLAAPAILAAAPPPARPKRGVSGPLADIARHVLAISLALVFVMPLLFCISASLKTREQIYEIPLRWIPHPIAWGNFVSAWTVLPFPRFVLNTLVITELCVIGSVLSSSLVAYGFARFSFPGKKLLFAILIATMLLPGQVMMIPVFLIWRHMGLVNTIGPLTIPAFFGGGAFNIFLFRQFYVSIPRSIDDAAMIDGCTPLGIWWRVLLPLSRPAAITVAIFTFTAAWEDFMGPLIYLHDPRNYTVSIGLQLFNDEYGHTQLNLLMAASMIHLLPMIILFLIAQRYFIRGITSSGLKD